MKNSNIFCKKICYFKAGDVVDEFINTLSTKGEITGGPDYFIYSTKHYADNNTQILYLSFAEKSSMVKTEQYTAKTIKTTKLQLSFGLHILQLVIAILKFKPHHIVCVKRRYLHVIYLISKIINSSFTISVHTDLFENNKIDNIVTRHLLKIADSIICDGPYLSKQASEITNNEQRIIEYNSSCNDIINLYSPLPEYVTQIKDKKIILFVGRVEIKKGSQDLYNACKKLLKDDDQLALCFAGDGKARADLVNQSYSDKLEKQVVFLGQLDRGQVASILRLAWVVVTPTKKEFPEGRCMAAMEALAMGVPVISPDFGPFPYLINNGVNGFLFRPDSISDLQNKLLLSIKKTIHEKLVKGARENSKVLTKTNLCYGKAFVQTLLYKKRQHQ